ncbi:unnamed protein product [Urochloa humidicola]
MSQAATTRVDRSMRARHVISVMAEGITAALKAGTLDVRTEEWRIHLLASGLLERDVLLVAAAVYVSRQILEYVSHRVSIAMKAFIFCVGVLSILYGALSITTGDGRMVTTTIGGIFVFMVVMFTLWDETRRRWAMEVQEEVLSILQCSLLSHFYPVVIIQQQPADKSFKNIYCPVSKVSDGQIIE